MSTVAIRGAITTNNSKEDIYSCSEELLKEIINENVISIENIISVTFTTTKDIDEAYPAVAARRIGITEASLMCVQEMYVKNSLKRCIRVSMVVESLKKQSEVKHVYLKGAKILRPDLIQK